MSTIHPKHSTEMHQNTTLYAELNGEHAGEGFMLLRSIILVLLDCPQLEEERRRFLGASAPTLSMRGLLGDVSVFLADGRLFAFVNAANLSVVYKRP